MANFNSVMGLTEMGYAIILKISAPRWISRKASSGVLFFRGADAS
jgi:hypothetical protein